MKATHVRNAAALAALLALGACGGKAQFDISGNLVDGLGTPKALANAGLQLVSGDQRLDVPVGATTFKFPNTISYGTEYNITVAQQPRHMTCNFAGGASGTAGRTATISATLICSQNVYTIGGVVNGLGDGTDQVVVLYNGTDTLTISKALGNQNFTMPTPVADGSAYGVLVASQPPDKNCTVLNGTDVMGEAPRNNIVVNCVPK
jgi:hypothetical protein